MNKIISISLATVLNALMTTSVYALDDDSSVKSIDTVMNSEDPLEDFNRKMFDFNLQFDDLIGKPVATAYNDVVPQPAKTGISNVFDNLTTPISAMNCFLQGKVEDGLSEIMRFTMNSTFGLLGLIDIAEPMGLEDKNEDFGQTLYHWGLWDESSYLVLPFVGSYTTRELLGKSVESNYDPVYTHLMDVDTDEKLGIFIGDKFVDYAQAVKFIEDIKNQPDPYVFTRESYLQYRTNLIFDGNAPQPDLDDFDFE